MKIAILGNGGREHALAVNISKSSRVKKLKNLMYTVSIIKIFLTQILKPSPAGFLYL